MKSRLSPKGELVCRQTLEQIYQKPFPGSYLKNPESGINVPLDGYNEELGIAFEYQGKPHLQENAKKELIFKQDLCTIHGIYLIAISHLVPLDQIADKIKHALEVK